METLVILAATFLAMFLIGKKYGQIVEQQLVAKALVELRDLWALDKERASSLVSRFLGVLKAEYAEEYDALVAELDKAKKAL